MPTYFTYFIRRGASAEGPFWEGGRFAKGRVTILLEVFLSGNKGAEHSEMYKPSVQLLKKMPHLGNFPFLSRIYFLVSSFAVWDTGTETVLQTNVPSAVESNKILPNSPELISKFKSPVLCKQDLCLGKCHKQYIGRGVRTRHPSSLNSHNLWPGGSGNLPLFVFRGSRCSAEWGDLGVLLGHDSTTTQCKILVRCCSAPVPTSSSALVFWGPNPRARASRRLQWVSGGFIHPDPDEQYPGWAGSMLIALAECPHWLRELEKLFPVRQGTGRNTSWRQLRDAVGKFQPHKV